MRTVCQFSRHIRSKITFIGEIRCREFLQQLPRLWPLHTEHPKLPGAILQGAIETVLVDNTQHVVLVVLRGSTAGGNVVLRLTGAAKYIKTMLEMIRAGMGGGRSTVYKKRKLMCCEYMNIVTEGYRRRFFFHQAPVIIPRKIVINFTNKHQSNAWDDVDTSSWLHMCVIPTRTKPRKLMYCKVKNFVAGG